MEEIRIAVLGNVDSAKTSLISTLSNKILDDGRGFARSKIFKHKHEKETGRTSSISFKYINDSLKSLASWFVIKERNRRFVFEYLIGSP